MSDVGAHNPRRLEGTRRELRALRTGFTRWLDLRRARDAGGLHTDQLSAIEACIDGAARGLEAHLDTVDVTLPRGVLAEQCRRHDLNILWLRRLWRFFQERLDQRDDPVLAPLLGAADEVVWSAWHTVFDRAPLLGLSLPEAPVPLPFIALAHSPAALPASWVPDELISKENPSLERYLKQLPVSLLYVPAYSLASPWWLVFLGHEVGHQLQYHLKLVDGFQQHLEDAVQKRAEALGLEQPFDAGERWGRWSVEVFADVYSVLTLGTAAVRALAEFELYSDANMAARRQTYPPAAVRLHLLSQLAKALGLPSGPGILGGADPRALVKGHRDAQEDLDLVDAMVEASLAVLPGLGGVTLKQLVGFDAAQFDVTWPDVPHPFDLAGPRRMASAALEAWSSAVDAASGGPPALDALAHEVIQVLGEKRLPGKRSGAGDPTASVDGGALADALLSMDADQLEAVIRGAP